jgi:hypothetical protein
MHKIIGKYKVYFQPLHMFRQMNCHLQGVFKTLQVPSASKHTIRTLYRTVRYSVHYTLWHTNTAHRHEPRNYLEAMFRGKPNLCARPIPQPTSSPDLTSLRGFFGAGRGSLGTRDECGIGSSDACNPPTAAAAHHRGGKQGGPRFAVVNTGRTKTALGTLQGYHGASIEHPR